MDGVQFLLFHIAQTYPRHCNDYQSLNKPVTSGMTWMMENHLVFTVIWNFGGGWTRIHQRSSSRISFNQYWNAYREGFGHLWYKKKVMQHFHVNVNGIPGKKQKPMFCVKLLLGNVTKQKRNKHGNVM